MKFEIKKDRKGEYIWRLKASNGEIIAHGESYTAKHNCRHAIDRIKETNADTPVDDLTQTR